MTSGDEFSDLDSEGDSIFSFASPAIERLPNVAPMHEGKGAIEWGLPDGRKVWLPKKQHAWVAYGEMYFVAYADWIAKEKNLPRTTAYKPGPPAGMPQRRTPSIHELLTSRASTEALLMSLVKVSLTSVTYEYGSREGEDVETDSAYLTTSGWISKSQSPLFPARKVGLWRCRAGSPIKMGSLAFRSRERSCLVCVQTGKTIGSTPTAHSHARLPTRAAFKSPLSLNPP